MSGPVAACAGQWRLFDSTNRADHYKAATICAGCPIWLQCANDLEHAIAEAPRGGTGFVPQGTWAGILYGHSPSQPECGTLSGYKRHKRTNHEEACDPCKQAAAAASRKQYRKKKGAAA